jgi:hypothetical protein
MGIYLSKDHVFNTLFQLNFGYLNYKKISSLSQKIKELMKNVLQDKKIREQRLKFIQREVS